MQTEQTSVRSTADQVSGANPRVARMLREVADLLAQQGANPFRVNAYRRAARTVDTLGEDIAGIAEHGGAEALIALPGIDQALVALASFGAE